MKYFFTFVLVIWFLPAFTQTIFIVRHAEKETNETAATMMKNDPPLSEAGKQRAQDLKQVLKDENINYIFSTKTVRTHSTAEPTRALFDLSIENYAPVPDSAFIRRLLSLNKNILVVGHSNTVDDLVNKIMGAPTIPSDLPDTAYDNLFVIKKNGDKLTFENKKYGQPSK